MQPRGRPGFKGNHADIFHAPSPDRKGANGRRPAADGDHFMLTDVGLQ